MKKFLFANLLLTAAFAATSHAITFDANTAFATAQSAYSTNSTFGQFTVGYFDSFTNGFTPFDVSDRDSNFATAPGVNGFWIHNGQIVPSAVVNTTGSAQTLPYSGTDLAPTQILLHPGGIGPNAFDPPHYDAVLRFVVPTTGFYNFTGTFNSLHSGVTLNGIYLNNVAFGTSILADDVISGGAQLSAGNTIDFRVGAGTDGIGSDSTGLFASVSVPDGGSTAMLLGLGLISMAGLSKFRKVG